MQSFGGQGSGCCAGCTTVLLRMGGINTFIDNSPFIIWHFALLLFNQNILPAVSDCCWSVMLFFHQIYVITLHYVHTNYNTLQAFVTELWCNIQEATGAGSQGDRGRFSVSYYQGSIDAGGMNLRFFMPQRQQRLLRHPHNLHRCYIPPVFFTLLLHWLCYPFL